MTQTSSRVNSGPEAGLSRHKKVPTRQWSRTLPVYWGIFDYVMANGLVTMEACYRHEIDSPWGMVFRVTMADPITVINRDVEENNIPVNMACGLGVRK